MGRALASSPPPGHARFQHLCRPPPNNNPCPTYTRVNIGRHVPEELDVPRRGADPVSVGALVVPVSGTDRGVDPPAAVPTLVPAAGVTDDGSGGRAVNDAASHAIWSAVKGESIPTRWVNRSDC